VFEDLGNAQVWLGGLDSNQDNQIQSLMYCRLYDLPAGGGHKKTPRIPMLQGGANTSTLCGVRISVNRGLGQAEHSPAECYRATVPASATSGRPLTGTSFPATTRNSLPRQRMRVAK
jgi:hypothetical protein